MREKLRTLSVAELRELAKSQGLKRTSTMRKQALIDWLTELHEAGEQEKDEAPESGAAEPEGRQSSERSRTPEKVEMQEGQNVAEKEEPREKTMAAESPAAAAEKAEPRGRRRTVERPEPREKTMAAESPAAAVEKAEPRGRRRTVERPEPREKTMAVDSPAAAERGRRRAVPGTRRGFLPESGGTAPSRRQPSERSRIPQRTEVPGQQDAAAEKAEPQERQNAAAENVTAAERRSQTAAKTSPAPDPAAEKNVGAQTPLLPEELRSAADQGPLASGVLEVMQEGYGFIRSTNYLPGEDDIYVSPSQIRRFRLKTGDMVTGIKRIRSEREKFAALLYVSTVNGLRPAELFRRVNFEDMTPVFPNQRIHLETEGASTAMRMVDLISPIGKGQRGMIVSPPKAGKTTLLKQIAKTVTDTIPDMHLIILLIDERPEEVTDIKEYIEGPQVEVIYSTFDKEPEQHKRVSEMVIERAKRLVEQHRDVMILLDSITRLARAYNLTVIPSGRTLSGGLDPAALHMPKRFFGAARNMREGGSLTILATALVDTGSRMDDVVYEEFKGTGNMELVLDRKLSERRVFPAVDVLKSGTRRDDLLLSADEQDILNMIHRMTSGARPEDNVERILNRFANTRSNAELIRNAKLAKAL